MSYAKVVLGVFCSLLFIASLSAHAQTTFGIWVNAHELATLPMSGPAWTALKQRADTVVGPPLISDQTSSNNASFWQKRLCSREPAISVIGCR